MRTGDETSPCKIGFTARNVESYTVDSGLELDKTYRFGVCADGRKGSSEIVYAPALELEDLTSPGIAFVGESTATESCIAFRYAPRNTARRATSRAASAGAPTIRPPSRTCGRTARHSTARSPSCR